MKKPLLFLFLFGIAAVHAQHIELGLDGSATYYRFAPPSVNWPTTIAPGVSLNGIYTTKHYEIGAEVGYQLATASWKQAVWGDDFFGTIPTGPVYLRSTQTVALLSQKGFVNRKIYISHLELYSGLFVGYLSRNQVIFETNETTHTALERDHAVYHDFIAGGQMGLCYPITKRIGISAQLEVDCDYFHLPVPETVINAFTFPVSLGVRYCL